MKFRDLKTFKWIAVLLLSLTFVPGCSKEQPDKGKESRREEYRETARPACAAGDITIIDMYLSPADRMGTGALYCTLSNTGAESDTLLGLSTPVTPDVEIHEMVEEEEMMTMRKLEGGLPIPANGAAELKLGGAHVMLINVNRVLKNGDSVEVEFRFARNGNVRCVGYVGSGPGTTSAGGTSAGDENEMGERVYKTYCQSCHQPDGKGIENIFPPLAGSDFLADRQRTIDAIVNGKEGTLTVSGKEYNGVMPPLAPAYDDQQAAAVINDVMGTFGSGAWSTTSAEVGKIRRK